MKGLANGPGIDWPAAAQAEQRLVVCSRRERRLTLTQMDYIQFQIEAPQDSFHGVKFLEPGSSGEP